MLKLLAPESDASRPEAPSHWSREACPGSYGHYIALKQHPSPYEESLIDLSYHRIMGKLWDFG